ncbi:MAG: HEAT repeat domain-containing protein, partial [Myxococcota bacterium]|nr:HEAT repeat domain-containing protein [Myxococcota bacterium]
KIDDLEIRSNLVAIAAIPGAPERLGEIVKALRSTEDPAFWEMIGSLLKLLDPSTVGNLLVQLGTLREERELPMFQDAIQHLCEDNPERLQVGLESKDEMVVLGTLPILERIAGPDARRLLTGVLKHSMPNVRKHALLSLTRMKATDLGERILEMISDSNGAVRTAAIGACLSIPAQSAQLAIANVLAHEDFPQRRREEQVKVLQVAARIKGDPVVKALAKYLDPLPLPWYKSQEGMMGMAAVVATTALVVLMWQLSIPVALGLWLVLGVGAWIGGMELVVAESGEATTLVEPVAKTLARIGTKNSLRTLHSAAKSGPREVQGICRRILKMRKELRAEQADLENPDREEQESTGTHSAQEAAV